MVIRATKKTLASDESVDNTPASLHQLLERQYVSASMYLEKTKKLDS
jgi:hypothetical protein